MGFNIRFAEQGLQSERIRLFGGKAVAVDVLVAKNAGTFSIGCSFGLSPHTLEIVPPNVLVHTPLDLIPLLVG